MQSANHRTHLFIRRSCLEATRRVENLGEQMDVSNCVQKHTWSIKDPLHC